MAAAARQLRLLHDMEHAMPAADSFHLDCGLLHRTKDGSNFKSGRAQAFAAVELGRESGNSRFFQIQQFFLTKHFRVAERSWFARWDMALEHHFAAGDFVF